jgi:multidrug efflux pump subunit AcrA (membrane-fusion protein)
LERQVINYELRSAELQAAVAAAETDPDYRNGVSGLRLQAEQVGTALKQAQFDREQMTLRSPIAGVVSGRGLRERAGTLLRRGDLLCEVLPEGTAGAIVVLGENEAGKIALGQTVAFRLSSFAGQTFSGRVLAITEQPIARLPHQSLGQYAGGTVPGVMSTAPGSNDPRNIEAVPTGQVFSVKVAIDDDKGLLRPGMSGRIKIHCGRRPLGLTLWDNFTSMLRTDFRL